MHPYDCHHHVALLIQVPVGMCKKMQRHLEDRGRQLSGAPALEVTRVPQQRALRLRLVSRPDDAGAGPVNPGGTGTEASFHCTSYTLVMSQLLERICTH